MIVDFDERDIENIDQLAPDKTIGIARTAHPTELPEAPLFDLNRVQAAIAAARDHFGERDVNVAIIEDPDGLPLLALWPDGWRTEAVVVASRERITDGDSP